MGKMRRPRAGIAHLHSGGPETPPPGHYEPGARSFARGTFVRKDKPNRKRGLGDRNRRVERRKASVPIARDALLAPRKRGLLQRAPAGAPQPLA